MSQRNIYINDTLDNELRLMRQNKGFVTRITKEAHIKRVIFSRSFDDLAANISSAAQLTRMQLLWAYDSIMIDDGASFLEGWKKQGEFILEYMRKHHEEFLRSYDTDLHPELKRGMHRPKKTE